MYCKLHAGATFLVCKFTVLYWIDNIFQHSSRSYRQITNLINRNATSDSGITSEGVTDFPAWGLPTLGSLHVYGLPVYKKTELKFCKYESGSGGVHVSLNRPCSSCLLPLFENEPSCKTLHTKKSLNAGKSRWWDNIFWNEWLRARRLVLVRWQQKTQKWQIVIVSSARGTHSEKSSSKPLLLSGSFVSHLYVFIQQNVK